MCQEYPFPLSDKQSSLEELLPLLLENRVVPLWDDDKMYQVVDLVDTTTHQMKTLTWLKCGWCVFRKRKEAELFKAYAAMLLGHRYLSSLVDYGVLIDRGVNLLDETKRSVAVWFISDMLNRKFAVEGIHTSILIQMVSNAIALNSECLELLETALAKLASGERI